MTTAGELDQLIRIEQRDPTLGALREQSKNWVTFVDMLPAKAVPIRGREFDAAGMQQQELTMRFRIRFMTGITEAMRIVWLGEGGDTPYDIAQLPMKVGRAEWLDLVCKTGTGDGR